ncbi:MAG: LacI family DNA-binding transcriptional regulator [Propionivibrio sp.]
MKDVAVLAGVSTSTVSRVINNSMPVDAETRLKVERAIRAINFKPNLVARGLRMKSANLIGMVVPELQHETFTSFIKFTEQFVEAQGYNLVIGSTNTDLDTEERFIVNLIRRNIDGIIFSRVSDNSQVLKLLEHSKVPVVVIDRTLAREDIPSVVMDNHGAGVMAAEHLLTLGHRRFACITGPMDISINRDRLAGFRETILGRGGSLDEKCVFEGNFKFESGGKGADYLLDTRADFTALWAQNDYMAIGAMNRLLARGIAVPADVSVVGLDNIEHAWMIQPALTTIAQPFKKMCESAVDFIVRMKRKEVLEATRMVLAPGLVVRATTSAPANSGRR